MHCGYKALCNRIIEEGFYWDGYSKEINNFIKNGHFCNADKKKNKIYPNTKIIIDEGPKYRYIMDLWTLPEELSENTEYVYIMDIVDHFSKYMSAYFLKNKTMKLVLSKLK